MKIYVKFCMAIFLFFQIGFVLGQDEMKFECSPCRFITAMVEDNQGDIWQTDEVLGLYKRERQTGKWICLNAQIRKNIDVGDMSFYAIACDQSSRIWVGTLRDGVLLWDGEKWQKITVSDGLLGERIFCIKVNPYNGDVWIATSGGVCVLDIKRSQWQTLMRDNGLSSDQIFSMTFTSENDAYLATDCQGVVHVMRKGNGYKMRLIQAPETFYKTWKIPFAPRGDGLPSNLCNEIIYTKNKELLLATTTGIAIDRKQGKKWFFIRGNNWLSKIQQLYDNRKAIPKVTTPSNAVQAALLPDDYILSLFEASDGTVLIASREKGITTYDLKSLTKGRFFKGDCPNLFFQYNQQIWVCEYGRGMRFLTMVSTQVKKTKKRIRKRVEVPAFPILNKSQFEKKINSIGSEKKNFQTMEADFFYQDWQTRGDWVGRYGRNYFLFCAHTQSTAAYSFKMEFIQKERHKVLIRDFIGPHILNDDSLRHWTHWLSTKERRSLWSPSLGTRRQAEIDDHGEAYSRDWEGPNIWLHIEPNEKNIPYRVSLYFYNKDGYTGGNRYRDWLVEIYTSSGVNYFTRPQTKAEEAYIRKKPIPEIYNDVHWRTPLARTRVKDFVGGVWVSFFIKDKPCWIKIDKNYSFNTFVCAVAIDYYDARKPLLPNRTNGVFYDSLYEYYKLPYRTPVDTSILVFKGIERARDLLIPKNGVAKYNRFRHEIYRYGMKNNDDYDIQKVLRWYANQFNHDDHLYFDFAMRSAFCNEERWDFMLHSQEYSPSSPGKLFKTDKETREAFIKSLEAVDSQAAKRIKEEWKRDYDLTQKARRIFRAQKRIDEKNKQQADSNKQLLKNTINLKGDRK